MKLFKNNNYVLASLFCNEIFKTLGPEDFKGILIYLHLLHQCEQDTPQAELESWVSLNSEFLKYC